MTDERTDSAMREKGFTQRSILYPTGRVIYRYRENNEIEVTEVSDGHHVYWIVKHPRRPYELPPESRRFANPIAAATYANRVVIPALLAGKESA